MPMLATARDTSSTGLPDPFMWTATLVTGFGECRAGRRPWVQLFPLLDVPVLIELRPLMRNRAGLLRLVRVRGTSPAAHGWEMVATVRDELRFRFVALRVEAAARSTMVHHGPPGPRNIALHQLPLGTQPEAWLATSFTVL